MSATLMFVLDTARWVLVVNGPLGTIVVSIIKKNGRVLSKHLTESCSSILYAISSILFLFSGNGLIKSEHVLLPGTYNCRLLPANYFAVLIGHLPFVRNVRCHQLYHVQTYCTSINVSEISVPLC